MNRHLACGWLLALAAPMATAAPGVELRPGLPLAVDLPPSGFSNAVYIDVPDGAERLTVRLDAANLAHDVDLLLRFDSPFPDTAPDGTPPEPDWLMEHAQFLSASARGDESVVITPASRQPLRGGRLYLSLINFGSVTAPATLTATLGAATDFVPFELIFDDTRNSCNVSGWSDPAPRDPIRGNSGTTLGEQRRIAVQEAARLLADELRPNAAIRMQMCWEPESMEFDNCSGTLASAGPRYVLIDNPGDGRSVPMLDSRYVMQASTVTVHQAGTARCRLGGGDCRSYLPDVKATFNSKVDASTNQACRFDYGLTGAASLSFVSTAMHEIGHGLGFIGFLSLSGDDIGTQPEIFGLPFADGYGRHALDVDRASGVARPLLSLPVEERIATLTSDTQKRLRFGGAAARNSTQNLFNAWAAPDDTVRLHAPATLSSGSTYSHLSGRGDDHPGNLMTASISNSAPRTLGLALDVLADVGWASTPRAVPAVDIATTQFFDPAVNGHGFDLRRIEGFDNLYFVVFYSYDENGQAEFYTTSGPIIDGVFMPARGETGDSLVRNLYLGPNQTVADPDPAFEGALRIDFVDAAGHPACTDGAPGRTLDGPLAIMSWELDGELRQWCTQPLIDGRAGAEVDFGNTWYQPSDAGWGLSVLSFAGPAGDGIGLQLYFPDADGRGRWALVQSVDFQPGASYPVRMPANGYCRTCSAPGEQQFVEIGTLSIDLREPGDGESTISFDVTWPGPAGGRFTRTATPIVPVGIPGYRE